MQRFVFSMRCAWDILLPAAAHGPTGREGGHATHCHCLVLLPPAGGDWTSGLGDVPEDAEGKPGGCASGSVLTLVPLRARRLFGGLLCLGNTRTGRECAARRKADSVSPLIVIFDGHDPGPGAGPRTSRPETRLAHSAQPARPPARPQIASGAALETPPPPRLLCCESTRAHTHTHTATFATPAFLMAATRIPRWQLRPLLGAIRRVHTRRRDHRRASSIARDALRSWERPSASQPRSA